MNFGISAVAIRAAEAHRTGRVHRGLVGLRVAGDASGTLAVGFGLRLAHQGLGWDGISIRGLQRSASHSRGQDGKKKNRCQRNCGEHPRDSSPDKFFFDPAIHPTLKP